MNIEKEMLQYSLKCESKSFAEKTKILYNANIKAFLKNFEHKENPSLITLDEFKNYIEAWPTATTKQIKINSVKSFYSLMEIGSFDFTGFEKPKQAKEKPKRIDLNFLLEAIREIDNRKHKAVLALAFASGMWINEILELKLSDIDFENKNILVRNRDDKKNRNIFLPNNISEILLRYIKKFNPKEYLFNGQYNIKYSAKSALCIVKKHIGEQYNFQLIRNTYIYFLIESGVQTNDVLKHLGLVGNSAQKRLNVFKKYSKIPTPKKITASI